MKKKKLTHAHSHARRIWECFSTGARAFACVSGACVFERDFLREQRKSPPPPRTHSFVFFNPNPTRPAPPATCRNCRCARHPRPGHLRPRHRQTSRPPTPPTQRKMTTTTMLWPRRVPPCSWSCCPTACTRCGDCQSGGRACARCTGGGWERKRQDNEKKEGGENNESIKHIENTEKRTRPLHTKANTHTSSRRTHRHNFHTQNTRFPNHNHIHALPHSHSVI